MPKNVTNWQFSVTNEVEFGKTESVILLIVVLNRNLVLNIIINQVTDLKLIIMKKLVYFSLAAFLIMTACSKNERFEAGQSPEAMAKALPLCSQVITVAPDQDGDGDDTDELTAAIAGAEPGSMIKLLEGEYHVGYTAIYGFKGLIVGAGRDKTIITLKTPIDQATQNNNNLTSCWFRVMGGDLTVSDMTFRTPDGFLSNDGDFIPAYGSDMFAIFLVNTYNDEYYHPEGPAQKFLAERCSFIGGTNPDLSKEGWWSTDHNTYIAIWVGMDYVWPKEGVDYPLTKGDYIIRDCKFEHFLDAVEGFSFGEEATMKVADCKMNNCMWPLYFAANYNAKISILNNSFNNSWDYDIYIQDTDYGFLPNTTVTPGMRCIYNVMGNRFNKSTVASIKLEDDFLATNPSHNLPMLINIKYNHFNLTGTGTGIMGLNSQDLVIAWNFFKGECSNGVVIDGTSVFDATGVEYPAPFANNALILGNGFKELTAAADILLGEKSSNCKVIGSGKESVVDNGVNNEIVEMHRIHGDHHWTPPSDHHFGHMNEGRRFH
jgi:hypothetical protein